MRGDIERCATGIRGFDALCNGGFVKNSDNVLVGGPGTGKSTFLLQFLWNGATRFNENGLYCSFEPDIVETIKDAQSFGWDFIKLNEEDRVKFLRFSPQTSVEELKSELTKLISKYQIQRICFDPISVLALNSEEKKSRSSIFELCSLMKRLKATTILADETLENNEELLKTDVIKFLSDSVTILYEQGLKGISERSLRIVKMRRTSHFRNLVGMHITNKGVYVLPPQLQPKES